MAAPADLDLLHRSLVRCLRAENRSTCTIYVYGLAIRQLADYLAGLPDPLARPPISNGSTSRGFSRPGGRPHLSATLNNRYRSLNRFFGYLVDEDEIVTNPMARMKPPFIPEHPVPFCREEQLEALLNACRAREFDDLRDMAIIRLLLDSGMRLRPSRPARG